MVRTCNPVCGMGMYYLRYGASSMFIKCYFLVWWCVVWKCDLVCDMGMYVIIWYGNEDTK